MQNILIVSVAVPLPLDFIPSYLFPLTALSEEADVAADHLSDKFMLEQLIGRRVKVPWGSHQHKIGVILTAQWQSTDDLDARLKPIEALIDQHVFLTKVDIQFYQWIAQYYHYPIGEVMNVVLPAYIRQGRVFDRYSTHWRISSDVIVDNVTPTLNRSKKQRHAFDMIALHAPTSVSENILKLMGVEQTTIQALWKKGFIEAEQKHYIPSITPFGFNHAPLNVNDEQQVAIDAIHHALGQYHAFLLEGATGSGKTEVYLQAIAPVLAKGQQVLMMVPEIGLTPQTILRFSDRFNSHIVTLHSSMTDLARFKAWQHIESGVAQLIIGTRSSIFAHFKHLGLIIIDEEHDVSFKQQDTLRYHARDIALYKAKQHGCPIVLGSATPALESYALVQQQKMQLLQLHQRPGAVSQVHWRLVDMRGQKQHTGLNSVSLSHIQQALDKQSQVLIFINRRGYSPVLMCGSCGWQASCHHCDANMTYHHTATKTYLHCHHCDAHQAKPVHCPQCYSKDLLPIGVGTSRLEEFLHQHFHDTTIIRVDRDTTKNKDGWEAVYQRIEQHPKAILVGTQMLAKGHHFPNVTLVVIVDADIGFYSADYKAPERAAQLIVQVAGRAGRAKRAGEVLIQTWQPNHPYLTTLMADGYPTLAKQLMLERQQLMLPPFRYSALIRAESMSLLHNETALTAFKQHCLSLFPDLEIWGPYVAPMAKKAGMLRSLMLLLSPSRSYLHQMIDQMWLSFLKRPERKGIRLTLDIDPQEVS